eukprot:7461322-Pyramimonas_sp.AAC.1
MVLRIRRATLAARAAHPVSTLSVWMWAIRQIPLDFLRRPVADQCEDFHDCPEWFVMADSDDEGDDPISTHRKIAESFPGATLYMMT